MKDIARGLAVAFLAAATALPPAAAGQVAPAAVDVFRSDSLAATHAQVSPDGRWVVLRVPDRGGAGLWMAPASGGTPFRITSEGHDDRGAFWFRSGDRITFTSSRPDRNGGRAQYPMVLSIDPVTGRPVGGPRQVGLEPVGNYGPPSPDGRWLAYVTATSPAHLKVVPSTGGPARDLGEVGDDAGGLLFGPASTEVYYQRIAVEGGARRYTVWRAPLDGGPPQVVAAADVPLRIVAGDPRFVLASLAADVRELRRLDGTPVGTVRLPQWSRSTQTADGLGLVGIEEAWTTAVRVASLEGGESRLLIEGGTHWPEAWMPDGSAVITDRADGGRIVVDILPLAGATRPGPSLPAGAAQSGWQSSVGPWFSYRVPVESASGPPIDRIFGVDVLTGDTREVAAEALQVGVRGRGGLEQDGSRWLYVAPGLRVHAVDPATGVDAVLAALPPDFAPRGPVSIHGDRVAWLQARGDSSDLMLARGSGAARRIRTFSRDATAVTWSWAGDRIAVADALPGTERRAGIWILSLAGEAVAGREAARFELPGPEGCDQFWWTPDDAQIVMLCYGGPGRIVRLRVADGRATTVVAAEEPQQVWEFYLSPDGRHVVYPVQREEGSSVHVVDLKPLLGR